MLNAAELQVLESTRSQMEDIPGHLGFYYKNLATGFEYGVRENEAYSAASVIKLPLFLHLLREDAEGRISLDEKLTITESDKVPICGALTLFTGNVQADLRTLCRLMISISDNTATNKLASYCGLERLEEAFASMGLVQTRFRRLLFDSAASARGITNTISPREMGMLLEKLYRNEFVNAEVCREAIETLLLQQVDHKLNGKICGAVDIAHKTGEDDELSNDVGIVYAPQPFVICFAGHRTDVYAWEDLMRRSAWELWQIQQPQV